MPQILLWLLMFYRFLEPSFISLGLHSHFIEGFPGGLGVKNPFANAGDERDWVLIPGLGKSPGGGHGNPLQYSCLENPLDIGAWWATVHRLSKGRAWLKWPSSSSTIFLFIYGCAGSLLLHGLFSTCVKWGLLSSCSVWASLCSDFFCGAWALGFTNSVVSPGL